MQDESAAADAGGLRLDDIQHHLHGDAGVDRAAALAEDREARLGGQRMGGDHHLPLRRDERLRREAGRALRLLEGASA